jgi:ABC-type lipoprotein release transport system permease subunit
MHMRIFSTCFPSVSGHSLGQPESKPRLPHQPRARIIFLAAFVTFFVALLTVSYQALRSATADPVDALRYE